MPTTSASPNTAQTIISLESLINSFDSRLESLTREMRTHKDMLVSYLDGQKEFAEAQTKAQSAAKEATIAKQRALKSSEAQPLIEKVKDYQIQIKEVKIALSDYLSQYITLSGTNQLNAPDGTTRSISISARLVKKKE
ncbi:MAG: hypothetical protein WCT01_05105 [Candidatus Shapirobacteria bacterium]|jgi:hypothetical protein